MPVADPLSAGPPRSLEAPLRSDEGETGPDAGRTRHADVITLDRAGRTEIRPDRRAGRQGHAAYLAAFVRHRPALQRRRLARRPGAARPRQSEHDADLYARDQPAAAGRASQISQRESRVTLLASKRNDLGPPATRLDDA